MTTLHDLASKTLCLITDDSKILFPDENRFNCKDNLCTIHRKTKQGWYIVNTALGRITIPKRHLKVIKTKLSEYGLTPREIILFRILRLNLNGYLSNHPRLIDIDLAFGQTETSKLTDPIICSVGEMTTLLAKLGVFADAATPLDSIRAALEPLLNFYEVA